MFKFNDPYYVIVSRCLFGIVFFISGLSGFVEIPGITFISEQSREIIGPILSSPSFYVLKFTELVIGISFITNFFVQTALVMAVPVVLNIILYNLWFQYPQGIVTFALVIPLAALFYFYRDTFKVFFKPQIYSHHMSESSAKIIVYDEVLEKSPDKARIL